MSVKILYAPRGYAVVVQGVSPNKGFPPMHYNDLNLRASASTPISRRLQPRTRGNGAERRNKGQNISWRN